ncbi:MAG: ATP-grasp domain-containing protein, partial [Desulfobulbaceae bacterium]|nr:ATP-grasp domain-containing protein [Desulfobulbaceae bacterium]
MRIGILGGGQLGRMLALAGYPLGLQFIFFDPAEEPCASQVGPCLKSAYDDENKLRELAAQVDLVTFEFENVPVEAVRFLEKMIPVRPGLRALEVAQDRLQEKNLFQELEIPVPAYRAVDSARAVEESASAIGLPMVLKTSRFGYDGKGQMVLRDLADIPTAWEKMQKKSLIAEKLVAFDREVSLLAVRGVSGETIFYPLAENVHHQGILKRSVCRNNDLLQKQAETYAGRILDAL